MKAKNKKKICLVASSLGRGGAEKAVANMSIALSKLGHEIHIVTILNHVDYEYEGKLFNLGVLKDQKDTFWSRFSRLKQFRKYLKREQFDIIIDHRSRSPFLREFIIAKYVYDWRKTIYVVHSSRLRTYFFNNAKLVHAIYKKFIFVAVSKAIQNKIKEKYQLPRVEMIHNAFDFDAIQKLSEEPIANTKPYILAYGRLNDQIKNYSLLIESYAISELPKHNIQLLLLGDGPDKDKLVALSKALNLTDTIQFISFKKNPYPYIKNALFTTLTSRYEGFPMVLPEALICGTPVISVACESGPSEVVINEQNGLLLENYDAKKLANAMNSFIFDKPLYQRCKKDTPLSVQQLSLENIGEQWEQLVQSI